MRGKARLKKEIEFTREVAGEIVQLAAERIGEFDGVDCDRCNRLLSTILAFALAISASIDERIGRVAAETYLDKRKNDDGRPTHH